MKALALSLVLAASTAFAASEIGQPAPEFTVKDSTGADVSLSDFKGKTVVLEWFNEGCPFVKKHYGSDNMQTLQKEATGDGVVWLTIVSSAPGKQGHLDAGAAAAKKEEIHASHLLLDESGAVGKLYDAKTTPEMFVIDGEGTLVYAGAIDDKPSPDPSTIDGATNYVVAAIEAVEAGRPVEIAETKSYGCGVKY